MTRDESPAAAAAHRRVARRQACARVACLRDASRRAAGRRGQRTLGKWHAGTNYTARSSSAAHRPWPRARSRSPKSSGTAAATATRSIRRSRAGRPTNPAYVEFVRIPVIWGPVHRQHAKLYYTIQALAGPICTPRSSTPSTSGGKPLSARSDERSARAAAGIPEGRTACPRRTFNAAYDSMPVAANVQRAEELTQTLRGGERAARSSSTASTPPASAKPAARPSCSR